MEYERIQKVQVGVISPSKLSIKLLGSHGGRKKEGRSNSTRASPSKLDQDMECSRNSLLACDVCEEDCKDVSSPNVVSSSEVPSLELSVKGEYAGYGQGNQTPSFRKDFLLKANANVDLCKNQNTLRCVSGAPQPTSNFSTVHPLRSVEEDGYGYDSGHESGSTHSFEFHRGERSSQHQVVSPFFRNLPSKWNDAEKWIVQRQIGHSNLNGSKKVVTMCQGSRQGIPNRMMVALGNTNADQKPSFSQAADTKRSSSTSSASQSVVEKFSFASNPSQSSFDSTSGTSGLTDLSSVSSDSGSLPGIAKETTENEQSVQESSSTKIPVNRSIMSVSMRDVGTEMTPIPSQDPSRTGTPIDATTPILTPLSSIPSSPKWRAPAPSPMEATAIDDPSGQKKEAFERELQMKTRREIAALGIQLGKIKITSWASEDDICHTSPSINTLDEEKGVKKEYDDRAAAWEESQKSKYTARYKRKEAKIQAWENQQREKYENKMRRLEAQIEQRRAQAQEKMMKKLAVTHRRVERKKATAEDRRTQQAARIAQQVEQIRQSGRIPTPQFWFCSWFS